MVDGTAVGSLGGVDTGIAGGAMAVVTAGSDQERLF